MIVRWSALTNLVVDTQEFSIIVSNVPFLATMIVGRERYHQSVTSPFELRPYMVSDPAKPPMVPSKKSRNSQIFFLNRRWQGIIVPPCI